MQDQEIKITTHPSGGIKIKEMENTLIEKLKSLTPTEGEWHADMYGVHSEGEMLYIKDQSNYSDDTLITLAPQMRTELIRMDEEMKRLKEEMKRLKEANKFLEGCRLQWAEMAIKLKASTTQPKIQMVTACSWFEPNPLFPSATLCRHCGKEKALHVTPQKTNP